MDVDKIVGVVWATLYTRLPATIAVVLVTLLVGLARFCSPHLDPREPPLLKPRIPVIGHLIGLIRHQNDYQRILSQQNPSESCVTLPILNGKLYGVYDPSLIQQVLRSRTASFEAFQEDFIDKVFGMSNETVQKIKGPKELIPAFTDVIHASFKKENLCVMNAAFLKDLARKMDPLSAKQARVDPLNLGKETFLSDGTLEVENFYLWCRDVMTLSTTRTLFGEHDPFAQDKSLLDAIWQFETAVPYFLLDLAPSITMPRSYRARQTIQQALHRYYEAGHHLTDPNVAGITRNRASFLQSYGLTAAEIGQTESMLPVVAITNSVPTFFWVLANILPRPDLVRRIREEVESFIQISADESRVGKIVSMEVSRLDESLPLIVSCYRETLRLANHSVLTRRLMEDVNITTQDGESFLLKKGNDVQLPAAVTHRREGIWGSEPTKFDPDRFLASSSKTSDAERGRKASYIPFGGGRHLCPGRNFAFAEIIAFVAILIVGFDVESTGIAFEDVQMGSPLLASSTVKPVNQAKGLSVRMTPRKDFTGVRWRFIV